MTEKDYILLEKQHIWHPCSQMSDYEAYPAIRIESAEGVWLIKPDGTRILDAISSWWACLFEHRNPHIISRIKAQLDKLEHVIFANYTHAPAIELAEKLSGLYHHQLPRVFYTDNGSSAVEAALKMSYHYWYNQGHPEKSTFAYLNGGYHGETLGSLAVGAIDTYKKIYEPLLTETLELNGPDCYRCPWGHCRETCQAECFASDAGRLEQNHAKLAAVIVEPIVQGAAGMQMYSPHYLRKLREHCAALEIHLICDEIAVGFGRTGKMTACEHAGVIPDLVTVSKALTGGYLPLAAVITSEQIYQAFYAPYTAQRAFVHSHTYTGNPLACTAALAVFELFDSTGILEKNKTTGAAIRNGVLPLQDHPHVGEIRTQGMITAIELVKDKKSKTPFDWKERIGYQIYRFAEKKGVMLRPLGNVIYFVPPYLINPEEIEFMTQVALESIREVLG